MKIEILLADDQLSILKGIEAILEPEPEIEVVGTARDGQSAIALVKKLRPDILLMDIEMPNMNGIVATKYIRKYFPDTIVIVLTSHKDQDYIAEALLAGASGYLWKGSLFEDLKQEIYSFGTGYPSIKARLSIGGKSYAPRFSAGNRLTYRAQRNSTTNLVGYREKIIYFRKYRKNIYQPAVSQQQQSRKINHIRPSDLSVAKAGMERAFKPSTAKKIKAINPENYGSSRVDRPPQFNRRKYRKAIVWLLLAIASIVLSIVIF